MLFSNKEVAVLQEKVKKLEAEYKELDKKYAIKLVQQIVFGLVGLALTALASAWVADALGILEKL